LGWAWGCKGYVPASGSGSNGVLIVAEAAGENEATEGAPLVGKAGYYFFQQLGRVGIERDGFRIHNVLSCRPPQNLLAGMPYESAVIASCSPLLDETIKDMREACTKNGRTFVILTLGKIAFKRIMDLTDKSPLMKEDYLVYPHWNQKYEAWVLACDHPSYLMRGNHHLAPVTQFTAKRALEIAKDGLTLEQPIHYDLDPEPVHFAGWAQEYLASPEKFVLSYDIETPYKQGEDEEKIAKEENDDYTIIRCSFAYREGHAVSVPWTAPYMATIQALFAASGPKVGWNSRGYDDERILSKMPINGDRLDAMLAWHVLNSALPKGLGFVTPFYWQNTGMWKQLSQQNPAFYNAKDADAALRCWNGIEKDLKLNHQWNVFQRHVINLNRVLDYMSSKGVLRDEALRGSAEETLTGLLTECEAKIQAQIPDAARRIAHVYKNEPKETAGLLCRAGSRSVPSCPNCGIERPRKDHFKVYKKKANPCAGLAAVSVIKPVTEYYRLADWKISKVGLMDYQRAKHHQPVYDRRTKKLTFDETALIKLQKRYPRDLLYPTVLDFRGYQKLRSTYIGVTENGRITGGMPIGPDGRIHTQFTTDASTLRSTSRNPNLQNLPRPKGPDDLATIIRNLIIPAPGHIFTARDYSGIEAVLVGYEAQAANYIRLAKLDVHSFYTAYALHELDGSVSAADLPDASWPDEKLIPCLAGLKKRLKEQRNSLFKHLVHGANFFQGAKGAAEKILNETGKAFPVELVQKVMDIYFALFPEIKKWHREEMMRAERDGFTRNAFGYVHRWSQVYEYEPDGMGGWNKNPGPQANQVIAFKPQSNAAGIIKEAMMRLYFNRFEEAGQWLRLLVHDELFLEVPENDREKIDQVVQEEMEKPIPELAIPASWGMGDALTINTEAKSGYRWGQMH
jgi:uracil-DNA glycosylase family 4